MKILSLFDGISVARVALERAGIPVEVYYASEIDRYAIQVSQKNYPDIIRVGSVVGLDTAQFKDIDLLIGGSPCQDLSIAKKGRQGLAGERSGLFWEYVRILNEVKPRYFILENVFSMSKEARQTITDTLGVEPIMIDAALVSAQRRKRLWWVAKRNGDTYEKVDIPQPEDRGILLKDILEDGDTIINPKMLNFKGDTEKCVTLTSSMYKEPPLVLKTKSNTIRAGGRSSGIGDKHEWDSVFQFRRTYWRETKGGKVPTLTANMGTGGNNVPYVPDKSYCVPSTYYKENVKLLIQRKKKGLFVTEKNSQEESPIQLICKNKSSIPQNIRKLTPTECERLQSLPDNYTECVSNTQRYKALGNAFNADVVAHILSFLPLPPSPHS